MKRTEFLRPFSTGHHHALVLCRRAREASAVGSPASTRELWTRVVDTFRTELAPHFAAEESEILPLLEAHEESSLADRTRQQHDELCRLMVEIPGRDPRGLLDRFVELMEAHVRFEERELFPRIEQLPPDALQQIAASLQAHPISVRPRALAR